METMEIMGNKRGVKFQNIIYHNGSGFSGSGAINFPNNGAFIATNAIFYDPYNTMADSWSDLSQ